MLTRGRLSRARASLRLAAGLALLVSAASGAQPNSPALQTADQSESAGLIPAADALSPADRARADGLLDQALPLIAAAEFDRSLPLVTAATAIYDRAWPRPEHLTRPLVDQARLIRVALELGPDRGTQAELMIRYALALNFEHGRDETYFAFQPWDADSFAALAIILHRRGKNDEARRVLRLVAASPALEVRERATHALLEEIGRLRTADRGEAAEATARFAIDALAIPAMSQDREYGELVALLAEMLRTRGAIEESARLLATRMGTAPDSQRSAAEQSIDDTLIRLFAAGQADRALALLAQVTGSDSRDLNLAAADKLDALASRADNAVQEEQLRRLALSIYERHLDETSVQLTRATSGLANTYVLLHRLDEAERLYRRALVLSQRQGGVDSIGTIDDTRVLADLLRRLGRPAEAEALLRRVWELIELTDFADANHLRVSTALTAVLLEQGEVEEADNLTRYLVEHADRATALPGADRVPYYLNRARVLQHSGRYAEAEALLRRAQAILPPAPLRVAGRIADIDMSWGFRRDIAEGLAAALEMQDRFAEAEPLRRPYYEGFSLSGTQAASTIVLATGQAANLSRLNRSGEADTLFAELGQAARQVFGAGSEQSADVGRAHALHLLGSGRTGPALDHARRALDARVELQSRINPSAGESAYLARMRQQKAAAWLFARTALAAQPAGAVPNEVFEALQRSEFTAAGAALARRAARDSAGSAGAGAEVAAWQDAQGELASLDGRIADLAEQGPDGDAERLRLLASREAAEQQLAAAEQVLARRHPRFFDLIASRPLPLDAFQGGSGLLRPEEALILLAPGSGDLPARYRNGMVLAVTREGTAWAEIPMEAEELEGAVYQLHEELAALGTGATDAPGKPAARIRFSRERAHALYRALFGDPRVAALLAGKERWTLAPQGALISLPFAALVTAPPPGGQPGDTDPRQLRATSWLGLERILAIVPSIPSVAMQRRAPPPAASAQRTPFFGLGDPAFRGVADPPVAPRGQADGAAPRGTRAPDAIRNYFRGPAADLAALATLARLERTAEEIRTLAEILRAEAGAVVLQLDATEAELRRRSASGSLRRANVVAFATHGLLSGELGEGIAEPALVLTPPSLPASQSPRPDNDGLLTASEAASLDLAAQWLILSACNTAAGGSADAESLSGLARAFFYAGARSLLVSHFPIFDAAAPHLTGEAVRLSQASGLDPPSAMREAMRRLIGNESNDAAGFSFAHPKAWAAFAVIDPN